MRFTLILVLSILATTSYSQASKGIGYFVINTSAQCGMCKSKIEKTLAYEKGVKQALVDLETNSIQIKYKVSKTDTTKLKLAVTKIGYDANDLPADSKAYKSLPSCCKKGGMH